MIEWKGPTLLEWYFTSGYHLLTVRFFHPSCIRPPQRPHGGDDDKQRQQMELEPAARPWGSAKGTHGGATAPQPCRRSMFDVTPVPLYSLSYVSQATHGRGALGLTGCLAHAATRINVLRSRQRLHRSPIASAAVSQNSPSQKTPYQYSGRRRRQCAERELNLAVQRRPTPDSARILESRKERISTSVLSRATLK